MHTETYEVGGHVRRLGHLARGPSRRTVGRSLFLAEVEPGQTRHALREPLDVLHIVPPRELQAAHARAMQLQILQEQTVPRRPAQPHALQRLQRAGVGVGGAGQERAREVPSGLQLAQARQTACGEFERRERAPAGLPSRSERDVEVEHFQVDVREQECGGRVQACVGGAP